MTNRERIYNTFDITWPIVAQMVIYTIINNADMMIVGRFEGNVAISALALSNNLKNIAVSVLISMGVSIGALSFISNKRGESALRQAKGYAETSIFLTLIIGILLFSIVNIFGEKILYLSGARNQVFALGKNINKANSVLMLIEMLVVIINSILVAYNQTLKSFTSYFIIFISKLIFNIVFLVSANIKLMGVVFFPMASIVCYAIGLVCSYIFLINTEEYKRVRGITIFNMGYIKDIIKLSLPSSIEEVSFSISRLLGATLILNSGTLAYAANEIANSIETISVMPGIGIGVITTTLIGYNYGKRDYNRIKKTILVNNLWGIGIMSGLALIFLFFSTQLVTLYLGKGNSELVSLTAACLAIGAFEQPSIAASSVFSGGLKGLKNTKTPFYISSFTGWCIRLPLMYLFIYKLKFKVTIVWWITALQWGVDALLMGIFFNRTLGKKEYVKAREIA